MRTGKLSEEQIIGFLRHAQSLCPGVGVFDRAPGMLSDAARNAWARRTAPARSSALCGGFNRSMPEKYREAIILRDFEEFSITEIADRLLLTREAVKSRIHRGRWMVQEYLKD